MKTLPLLLPAITLGLAFGFSTPANAITLTQAQVTIIVKDVKTIDPGKPARPATVKETVEGDQSVRTGIASRTELLFNDRTITRLGASTHFSFAEGTRNMSLQSGAMLLQVPKNIGGATIDTPAVTAGVTGTTILLDAGPKYTKLIVLEGECYLLPKVAAAKSAKKPGKLWARAGQEIVFLNGSNVVSKTFYINLKLVENTSLLLTGKWPGFLDNTRIFAAANKQRPGDYLPEGATAGAGSDSQITIAKLPQSPGSPPSPPPPPPVVIPPRNNR